MQSSPLATLRNPGFRTYWLAGLSANFGWQIQLVGASWLMILLGGTPQQVALVQTFVALPVMLLSLPGGALTDRFGQRTIVLWAQSFLLIVSIALAACAYLDILTPPLLLACTLLIGAGRALYYPGWQSMVLEFFSRGDAPSAFVINNANLNIARSLGPAIGGLIVATVGAFLAFVVNALSNVSVLIVARAWEKKDTGIGLPPEPFGSAIMAGLRYIALSPTLVTLIFRSVVFNIAAVSVMATLPLVARDILGGGPQVYGVLLGAFGVGAVVAAFSSQALSRHMSLEGYIAVGFLAFSAAIAALGFSTSLSLSVVASLVGGACWMMVQTSFGSTNHVSSPRWVISRSIAIYQTCIFGGAAFGSVLWGTLAGAMGTSFALYSAAGLMAAGSLLGVWFKVRVPDATGLDPQSGWVAPSPKVDMVLKSGPILTTISYRILEVDAPSFLDAMQEKRRNRIRDGASNWTLSCDILDPELWFERFKVATWADAQRLHARRTVAGGKVIEIVRALHQGPGRPEVHYELVRQPWRRQRADSTLIPGIEQ